MTKRMSMENRLALIFVIVCVLALFVTFYLVARAEAHPGTLDAYGCHSNKALFGTTAKRECHADLLAGQVFASTTAEYKAYIAAQQVRIDQLTAELQLVRVELTAAQSLLQSTVVQSLQAELERIKAAYLGALTLTWNANTEPDVVGYRVYCGTASRVYSRQQSVGKVTTIRVLEVPAGTWYCAVTAVDQAGNESVMSQEVRKVLP